MAATFENRRAIVTGAAHGIGKATALRLGRQGASVIVADLDQSALSETAAELRELGAQCDTFAVDVANRQEVASMVEHTVTTLGGVDILVANAGIMDREPFLEMSDKLWDRVLSVNLKGVFLCGQEVARQMVTQGTGGKIINLASNSGIFGGRGRAAYGASKAAIINLTQTMAIELAEHQILVNAVAPGATRTRAVSGEVPAPSVYNRAPLQRFADADEIAAMICFAASDDCTFTTGHVLPADGGFTIAGVMEG